MKQVDITFIIPAYNEELSLPKVLESIVANVPQAFTYEIIVADNGSQDDTVRVARTFGVHVIVDDTATVGGLRNRGVELAQGQVLVFLDADILLTEAWGKNFPSVFQSLTDKPWQVTGSRCGIPANESWIERYWFKPLLDQKSRYINSGHLIVTREFFEEIGGFDSRMESGEDYAFSMAAMAANASVVNNPLLEVVHEGYPKNISQFMRREIWHGRGDCTSVQNIKKSNVALVSIFFTGLVVFSFLMLMFSDFRLAGIFGLLLTGGLCVAASIYKHGGGPLKSIAILSILYCVYFFSRFLSCLSFRSADGVRPGHRNSQ
jgi:glycosyltransferase involved in cell wall biosynthesis